MKGKTLIGLIFILFGIGILLEQFGLGDFWRIISTWWPLLLIFIGVWQLINNPVSKTSGLILIVFGIIFQLRYLNIITLSLGKFIWPVIIIIIGIYILTCSYSSKKSYKNETNKVDDDVINNVAIFSGIGSKSISNDFKGGSTFAAFGGLDIDLRQAALSNEGAVIDATAVFGGIEIKVPETWKVSVTGFPLFGGWSNETKNKNNDTVTGPILKVHCFAAFGGIEVKN